MKLSFIKPYRIQDTLTIKATDYLGNLFFK